MFAVTLRHLLVNGYAVLVLAVYNVVHKCIELILLS